MPTKTLANRYGTQVVVALYSRDGKDSSVLKLRAANDILNSLIRLEIDRGCRCKPM